MVPSLVILHGSYGSPFENWFGWLAQEASQNGLPTFVPQFPTPDGQGFGAWSSILDGYREAGCLGADSVLVAHSSGCPFAVRYVAERGVQLRLLVTVSGFDQFLSGDAAFDDINKEVFTRGAEDYAAVRKHVARRVAYYSPSDPYLPAEKLQQFAQDLDAEVREVEGAGHFNADAGYTTFPDLRELVLGAGADQS